jgi:RNA polymerase sigma-70 factor (ECF subfamily)
MKLGKGNFWSGIFASEAVGLRSFLRRRVDRAVDAQDLEQEVYARLLRLRDNEVDLIRDPHAYLHTVAHNLLKEHALLRRRRQAEIDIALYPDLHARGGSSEDEVARALRAERMSRILAGLPERCRAVLIMQYREDMRYADIAARLGVSTHMVKKYVVRALKLCREAITDEERKT